MRQVKGGSHFMRAVIDHTFRLVASPRTGVMMRNIAAAFSGRAVNILTTILAIPVAVRTLGQVQYGTLAVIISLTTFFAYADFGLGTALITELAETEANGDHAASQRLVSQVWFFLIGCAAAVVALGSILYANGFALRLLPGVQAELAGNVWFILLYSSALGIPLAIPQRMCFALQMGVVGQVWSSAGRVSVLVGVIVAAYASPRLDTFVIVFVLVPNLVAGAFTVHLFFRLRPDLCPRLAALSVERLRHRIAMGFNFTVLQLIDYAEVGVDTILISQFYDLRTVAQYDLLSRLFGYVLAVVGMGMGPVWPAVSAAAAQSDYDWIVAARRAGYWLMISISVCAAVFLWFESETIVRLWTSVRLTLPDQALLKLALALFVILNCMLSFQRVLLNAFKDIKIQVLVGGLSILLLMPLKYMFLDYTMLYGVAVATIAIYIPKWFYFAYLVEHHIEAFKVRRSLQASW